VPWRLGVFSSGFFGRKYVTLFTAHTTKNLADRRFMILYAATIFLGAGLLFLIQPIVARTLIPWYGGSASVWTTCMLFFQCGLLAGYGYAHAVVARLSAKKQAVVHLLLLIGSLTFLPIAPSEAWKPDHPGGPVIGILMVLTVTVGVTFLTVATTAPLLQHWLGRTHPKFRPYRLYAVSNIGAILGLLSYPFLIEPRLSLETQSMVWSIGYGVYAALYGVVALGVVRHIPAESRSPSVEPEFARATPLGDRWLWGSLAACGSALLLATTNQMCRNVAVVPFLFLLPLSLYLLTFVICFEKEKWYRRGIWTGFFFLSLLSAAVVVVLDAESGLVLQIVVYSTVVFTGCMVCHGELVRLKPPARELTSFYIVMATGGALGGAFVSLVAPYFFADLWEFPLTLISTVVLAALSQIREEGTGKIYRWMAAVWMLVLFFGYQIYDGLEESLVVERNFYGVSRVVERDRGRIGWRRYLWHGGICHGSQYLHETRRREPTMYYTSEAGISITLENHPKRAAGNALRIGVIGLGTGTLAAYGERGDEIRFYEINPGVVRLAEEYFYYLEDSAAEVEVILGDGRIALERELREEGSQEFDILAVDAFSGDAIPVHLLTREALALYWEHLAEGGVLAFHISNLYLDLQPVVRGLAGERNLPVVLIESDGDLAQEIFATDWVLVTENGSFLSNPKVAASFTPWMGGSIDPVVWTDDYSHLFGLVKSPR
jgi:hypothetical protein